MMMSMNMCNTTRFEVQFHGRGFRVVDNATGERIMFTVCIFAACKLARKLERESVADLNN